MDDIVLSLVQNALREFKTIEMGNKQRRNANVANAEAAVAHIDWKARSLPHGPVVFGAPLGDDDPANLWLCALLQAVVAAAAADIYIGTFRRDTLHEDLGDVRTWGYNRLLTPNMRGFLQRATWGNVFVDPPLILGMYLANPKATNLFKLLPRINPWTGAHHLHLTAIRSIAQMRADVMRQATAAAAFFESARGMIVEESDVHRTAVHRYPLATAAALVLHADDADTRALFTLATTWQRDADGVRNADAAVAAARVAGLLSGHLDSIESSTPAPAII
jgi:hypothetical protein